MFIFFVQVSHVDKSVIPYLLDQLEYYSTCKHIRFKYNCVLPEHIVFYRYVETLDTEFVPISYRI